MDSDSAIATFELPRPAAPAHSPRHWKLLRSWKTTKQPKTLQELVTSSCSTTCSFILQPWIASTGINLLATDPAVVDLLLSCVHAVPSIRCYKNLNLLLDCPHSIKGVKSIVNKLPALPMSDSSASSSNTLSIASTTSSSKCTLPPQSKFVSQLGSKQQNLLTWLLSSPFSGLASVTATSYSQLLFPSLKGHDIRTFVVTRQPPNKEAIFREHCKNHAPVPVFHGTHASRLPSILTQGLKSMSGTKYQANGKSLGEGIYLGSHAETSLYYATFVEPWKASQFRNDEGTNLRVLLGCEVAGAEKKSYQTYVEPDASKVMVRFVFLIVGSRYTEPPTEIVRDLGTALSFLRAMRQPGCV